MSSARPSPDARRQLWLVPQAGDARRGLVADVAIEARTYRLHSYAVPGDLQDVVRPGARVRAPWGRRARTTAGICIGLTPREWDHALRPLLAVEPGPPLLNPALIELGLWLAEYYAAPPGLALATMLPAAARPRRRKLVYLRLPQPAPPPAASATGSGPSAAGLGAEPPAAPQKAPAPRISPGRRRVLELLAAGERRAAELRAAAAVSPAVLAGMIRHGLIERFIRADVISAQPATADPDPGQPPAFRPAAPPRCEEDDYVLNAGQSAALAEITAARPPGDNPFRVFLLFGVPGSGKTEVYVRAIRQTVAAGRQAILLVPEIALATQVVERLARRFARVAVLHSRLTERARRAAWAAITAGEADVVIGTRSAVFAPCPRLGLLVVDEEQDSSYKSLSAPYYHARDIAIKRAQLERIPAVLGSATPALETWHNAATFPHFRLLRLPDRIGAARLPTARLVPTGRGELGREPGVLASPLRRELAETLAAGDQALLLHNRRGYSVGLRCVRCGLFVICPQCAARMVYHQAADEIRCHRCGRHDATPAACLDTSCGGNLQRVGSAIQRLEEQLRRDFPQARVLRLDSDTMRRRADYAEALSRFEGGAADILIGTQMVAKGLDFPRVRMVGVVDADAALTLPDFRAAEQVFQLVMQVVGRAGRRAGPSLALVQAADVQAPAVRLAVKMDFEAFALLELAARRRFGYPPFGRLARLVLADARVSRARQEAQRLAAALCELAGRIDAHLTVSEPSACVIARQRQRWRWQLLLRGPRDAGLQKLLRQAADARLLFPRVERFAVDVDPVEML